MSKEQLYKDALLKIVNMPIRPNIVDQYMDVIKVARAAVLCSEMGHDWQIHHGLIRDVHECDRCGAKKGEENE